MPYSVYILYSSKLKQFYKGQTSNLNDRIERHNAGYEKSTSPGIPWILVWSTTKKLRSAATSLERKLKNLSQKRLVQFMLKYESSFAKNGKRVLEGLEFEP